MKKTIFFYLLTAGLLSAQTSEVTIVGKIIVTPELSIALFSETLGDPAKNEQPKPRPGYDAGTGYLVSPRQYIQNIPRTRGRYGMLIQSSVELNKEIAFETQAFYTNFGETFFYKTSSTGQLHFWGLGGNAISASFDLPWQFKRRIVAPANATHIYVGTLVFRRNMINEIIGFEVRDEYNQAVAELQTKVPGARLVRADLLPLE